MKQQLDAAFRLRRAIVAVSDTLPTHAKCVVDQYLRHITPTFAKGYGVEFPHTCRQHPMDKERCRDGSGMYPLIFFHVGNAILAYYDLILGREAPTLDARIAKLEDIAVRGFNNFAKVGTDAQGYHLVHVEEARRLRDEENTRELARFQADNAETEANAVPAATK